MELLRWKARLSVLWLTMAIGTAAVLLFTVFTPGMIEDIMAGHIEGMQINEGIMVVWALFLLIPLLMAILCLTLNGAANRWLNFILGIVWGLWFVFEIAATASGKETVFIAEWLMTIGGLVISAFIAWFAWKWPKLEA